MQNNIQTLESDSAWSIKLEEYATLLANGIHQLILWDDKENKELDTVEILSKFLAEKQTPFMEFILEVVSDIYPCSVQLWDEYGIKLNGKRRAECTRILICKSQFRSNTITADTVAVWQAFQRLSHRNERCADESECEHGPAAGFEVLDIVQFPAAARKLTPFQTTYINGANQDIYRLRTENEDVWRVCQL